MPLLFDLILNELQNIVSGPLAEAFADFLGWASYGALDRGTAYSIAQAVITVLLVLSGGGIGYSTYRLGRYIKSLFVHPATGGRIAFKDKRDGREYETIRIAGRRWMAENLAYMPHVSPCHEQGGIWVYGFHGTDTDAAKATSNYRKYGCLYDHETAKLACPSGWRLPTRADFKALLESTGGAEYETRSLAYYSLKAGGDSGFNALLGGNRVVYNWGGKGPEFEHRERCGDWWSSERSEGGHGLFPGETVGETLHVQIDDGGHFFTDALPVDYGVSIRCVKK
ncbi:MAG: FISUMP domain-containing protein [Rhizomicrobium sp.]|jgi:uncharacterized protein (TIGR02145 family)